MDIQGQSIVYFGRGDRAFEKSSQVATTIGAFDIIAVSLKSGIPPKLVFSSGAQQTIGEEVPLYLYWGGPEGIHPKRKMNLVNDSDSNGMAADFDRAGSSTWRFPTTPWMEITTPCRKSITSTETGLKTAYRGDRCVQYRVVLVSDNGDRFPSLERVKLRFH